MWYVWFLGGITEGFEFQMDEDTEVYTSCSAQLNGEVFVFGGSNTNNNKKKQVNLVDSTSYSLIMEHFCNITDFNFRSQKLLAVDLNELAI